MSEEQSVRTVIKLLHQGGREDLAKELALFYMSPAYELVESRPIRIAVPALPAGRKARTINGLTESHVTCIFIDHQNEWLTSEDIMSHDETLIYSGVNLALKKMIAKGLIHKKPGHRRPFYYRSSAELIQHKVHHYSRRRKLDEEAGLLQEAN